LLLATTIDRLDSEVAGDAVTQATEETSATVLATMRMAAVGTDIRDM
jgi:hypothetical protein